MATLQYRRHDAEATAEAWHAAKVEERRLWAKLMAALDELAMGYQDPEPGEGPVE